MRRTAVAVGLVVAAAAVALLALWLRPRPQPPAPSASTGRVLVRLPPDYRASTLSISDDGKDYAFIIDAGGGCQVVRRGRRGPRFADCSVPRFARGAAHVFHWAMPAVPVYERAFNWIRHWGTPPPDLPLLVIDDEVVETGFARPAPVIFNPDGTRWAVAGRAPDRTEAGKTVPGAVAVIADGQALGRYKDASWPAFSPDGKHLAYLIDDGTVRLIVDGDERRAFERPPVTTPEITQGDPGGLSQQLRVLYLADGTLLAIAPGGDGWRVYRDDQELATYAANVTPPAQGVVIRFAETPEPSTAILARSLAMAEKAPVAAWWERTAEGEGRWRVSRNGTPEPTQCARYWKHDPPVLSRDGQHVAYPCHLHPEGPADDVMVVADGKQFGPYKNAAALTFSPDGTRIAYAASDGKGKYDWSYYVDGTRVPLRFELVWPPRFNETGTHIAWQAQRGKRPVLFLDGRSVRSFDEVLWGPVFSPEDSLAWVIRRGRRVIRVQVPVG